MSSRRGHHEGSIYRDGDRWVAAIDLGRDPRTGKRRRRKRTATTRAEARRALKALQAELDQHGPDRLAAPNLTVGDYLTGTWLPRLDARVARGEIRPQTADGYRQRAETWIISAIGDVRVRDLRPGHVEQVLDTVTAAGRSTATANRVKAVLSLALNDARRAGLPVTNVANDVTALPETTTEPAVPTVEQARALLAACDGQPLGIAVVLMATIGLRVGEALGLAWADVDLAVPSVRIHRQARRHGGQMTFPDVKSAASRRTIVLPDVTAQALAEHRQQQRQRRLASPVWIDPEPGPLVVTSTIGTAVERGNLRRWWAGEASARTPEHRRTGVRDTVGLHGLRLHDLRHSAATFALASGASAREVADLLGHADGGALVLGRYGHVLDQRRHENAARINGVFSPDGEGLAPRLAPSADERPIADGA